LGCATVPPLGSTGTAPSWSRAGPGVKTGLRPEQAAPRRAPLMRAGWLLERQGNYWCLCRCQRSKEASQGQAPGRTTAVGNGDCRRQRADTCGQHAGLARADALPPRIGPPQLACPPGRLAARQRRIGIPVPSKQPPGGQEIDLNARIRNALRHPRVTGRSSEDGPELHRASGTNQRRQTLREYLSGTPSGWSHQKMSPPF
jgi:hypothetical protein